MKDHAVILRIYTTHDIRILVFTALPTLRLMEFKPLLALCSSRNYPYLPHERDFFQDLPPTGNSK